MSIRCGRSSATLIRFFRLRHPLPPPASRAARARAEHPAVDPGNLALPIATAALSRPAGEALRRAAAPAPPRGRGGPGCAARSAAGERAAPRARRRLTSARRARSPIAHQCFNTEYVFDETVGGERRASPSVQARLAQDADYALYAAYRPLRHAAAMRSASPSASPRRRSRLSRGARSSSRSTSNSLRTGIAVARRADQRRIGGGARAVRSAIRIRAGCACRRASTRRRSPTSCTSCFRTIRVKRGARAHPGRGLRHGAARDRHRAALRRTRACSPST